MKDSSALGLLGNETKEQAMKIKTGALMISIGFGDPLYYSYKEPPQKIV